MRLLTDRVKVLTESLETAHSEAEKREAMLRRIGECPQERKEVLPENVRNGGGGERLGKPVPMSRQAHANKGHCEEPAFVREFVYVVLIFL